MKTLLELIHIALGYQKEFSHHLTADEWKSLHVQCEIHGLAELAFVGIQKLSKEQQPPSDLYIKWSREVQVLNERKERLIKIFKDACETYNCNGFDSCILMPRFELVRDERLEVRDGRGEVRDKGLEFLGDLRDIDILCWSKDKKDGKRTIVEYVNFQYVSSTKHIKPKVVRQHVDWKSGHIPIDVQLRASLLNNPWYNKRYATWRREMVERTSKSPCVGRLGELPVEFYVVYQLLHLYKRFFCEDLRFGHLLEYYYTLKTLSPLSLHRESARPPLSPSVGGEVKDGRLEVRDERLEVMRVIENLGMRKFAGAVMYVLQTAFNMPDEYLLCKPDVRHGSFVLKMTNLAGEYGRAYERTRTLSHLGKIGRYLYWIKRNRPFITQYPSEMLFETYRKIVG